MTSTQYCNKFVDNSAFKDYFKKNCLTSKECKLSQMHKFMQPGIIDAERASICFDQ